MKKTVSKIREIAEKAGMTKAYQLQKATGLSPSMASRLFNGEGDGIQFSTLDKLCDALECEPGDLLVRIDDSKPAKKAAKK